MTPFLTWDLFSVWNILGWDDSESNFIPVYIGWVPRIELFSGSRVIGQLCWKVYDLELTIFASKN